MGLILLTLGPGTQHGHTEKQERGSDSVILIEGAEMRQWNEKVNGVLWAWEVGEGSQSRKP